MQNIGIDITRLASVRSVDLTLSAIDHNREETIAKLIIAGRKCIEEDGAQVIVLGCLSFLGMAQAVSEALGVPVIDPALAALGFAESMIRQGLSHSKKAYPKPPAGKRQYTGGAVEII